MKKFLSIAKLMRVENLVFIAAFQVILRYCIVLPILLEHDVEPVLSTTYFVLMVVATVMFAASGNVINDYFDVSIDAINRPERLVVGTSVERREAMMIHVVLTLIAVGIGLYLAMVFQKEVYALLFVGMPIVLWFYSTHLKKMMLLGNLTVSLMIALTGYLVVSFEQTALVHEYGSRILSTEACELAWFYTVVFAVFGFFANLCREIIKDMEDMKGDAACGCHTLPLEMGTGYSKVIVIFLEVIVVTMVLAVFYSVEEIRTAPYVGLYIYGALLLPTLVLCVMLARAKESKHFHRVSQISKLVMVLGVGLIVMVRYSIDHLV